MAPTEALAAELRRIAGEAGLEAVGVCTAEPFDEARRSIEGGLERGRDAGMQFTYRNPKRSTDPSMRLPGARALVVGARRYERRPDAGRCPSGTARPLASVARYAWEDPYTPLRAALEKIAARLRDDGWQAVVVADDNSLVDRAAAVRAGLGWYGRNTNVLLPGAGSWFVLGSVITDAPLAGDAADTADAATRGGGPAYDPSRTPGPVPDGCGSCRRCVQACPTGALDGEGHLDARRCLAWLAQSPGSFAGDLRVAMGDRIYGCDDCQEACPVNKLASRRHPPAESGPEAATHVDALGILGASDQELIASYGRWYIPKRDPDHLRRNALIVLGNVGDPRSDEVRAAVRDAIRSPVPMLRAHGVWAAARLGLNALVPEDDPDEAVAAEISRVGEIPCRAASP